MLVPARVDFAAAGPGSADYGDRYHSAAGALRQARDVFLAGCDLPAAWCGRRHWTVLETGFGLGFNFLTLWQAWRNDPQRPRRLHFLSIERHPVALADLDRAHAAEPGLAALARELRLRLPPLLAGCHRIEFEQGAVALTLVYGDGAAALAELDAQADTVFLDGFAPARNPDLWSAALLTEVARLARSGARLSTWCAAGGVRRSLTAAGFSVTRGPGFESKWETTQAVRRGGLAARSEQPPVPDELSVLVIGAGVAGCQLAVRLARGGWQVALLDAAAGPASGASGNPAGVIRPLLARDDNGVTRYTRAAFLYAIDCWRDGGGRPRAGWHPDGVIQVAQDPAQWTQWQATLAEQGVPAEFAWLISQAGAGRRLGLHPAAGGLMFPLGGWLEPARLCADLLARAPEVQVHWSAAVAHLAPCPQGWEARDGDGRLLARASQAVLCVGAGRAGEVPAGPDFLPAGARPLQALRGEVTELGAEGLGALDAVICGAGYLSPAGDHSFSLGATYDRCGETQPTEAGRSANLEKLGTLTGLGADAVAPMGGRVAWRSVAPDRLPVIGADPDRPGLWHLRGLASRGLVWSPLAAEQLAAAMNQEPSPIARSLEKLVSIDRPLLKRRDPL